MPHLNFRMSEEIHNYLKSKQKETGIPQTTQIRVLLMKAIEEDANKNRHHLDA